MTESEFLAMKQIERDKIMAEAMGKCWHEWEKGKVFAIKDCFCIKCGLVEDNTDYSSPEGIVEMMEWLIKKFDIIMSQSINNYIVFRDGLLSGERITLSESKSLSLALQVAICKVGGMGT